jgi:hypothetical protein
MPRRAARDNPRIFIRTKTSLVTEKQLRDMIPALQHQVTEHFEPVWGVGAKLTYDDDPRPRGYQIVIRRTGSKSDDGYLGYHFSPSGYPVASIFAETDMGEDGSVSDTLSHEILEMLVDPACNLYASRPGAGTRPGRGYFYEVCDPVETQKYKIDDYKVCDFVYPEWYEYAWKRGSRRFDHLKRISEPFEILPGCYADLYEVRERRPARFRTIWGSKKKGHHGRHRLRMRLLTSGYSR